MSLGNLKIGFRLGLCFGLVILLTLFMGLIAVDKLKSTTDLTSKLYRHPYTVTTTAQAIETTIIKMHRSMKDVALAKDRARIDEAVAAVDASEKDVYKGLETLKERFLGDKRNIVQFEKEFAAWKPIRDEVITLTRAGEPDKAAEITRDKGAKQVQSISREIAEIIAFARNKAAEFVSNSESARDKALSTLYLMFGLLTALVAFLGFFNTRSITRPLNEAVSIAQKIAKGKLAMAIEVQSKDETGDLQDAMKTMIENLSDMLRANITTSHSLAEAASQQAASLEETSSSMEEMSSMTKQNADNAAHANSLMQDVAGLVNQANGSMTSLTQAMNDIAVASDDTAKIIKTIDEIAFQTNLLALNAAVEAARAGEAGAGFAVVADEVRNLAMRAADAARNTSVLIESTVVKVKDGAKLVTTTSENFVQVTASTNKVNELIGEIAAASNDQAQGIGQVNTAITELDRVTQQNAASSEELAASLALFEISDHSSNSSIHRAQQKIAGSPIKKRVTMLRPFEEVHPDAIIPMDESDF